MARKKKQSPAPTHKTVGVLVRIKAHIPDSAGNVKKNELHALGFVSVTQVHVGKYLELNVPIDMPDETVEEMCKKLLANPVIEEFEIVPPARFSR